MLVPVPAQLGSLRQLNISSIDKVGQGWYILEERAVEPAWNGNGNLANESNGNSIPDAGTGVEGRTIPLIIAELNTNFGVRFLFQDISA